MMKLMPYQLKSDTGAALVTIVWSVLLLSILAAGLLKLSLTMRSTTEFSIEQARAKYIAQSAMDVFFTRYFYDEEGSIYRDGAIEVLGHSVNIHVSHESGKININRANIDYLSLVFAANGVAELKSLQLASAMIDWRDADDSPLVLGAESADYVDLEVPFGPRNGAFESVGELQFVTGMTTEIYHCVRPLLTAYSLSNTVSYFQADPQMLSVLDWAYSNDWQDVVWEDPDEVLSGGAEVIDIATVGGQALEVTVSIDNLEKTHYKSIIRYKGTADRSYSILKPLQPYDASINIGCQPP